MTYIGFVCWYLPSSPGSPWQLPVGKQFLLFQSAWLILALRSHITHHTLTISLYTHTYINPQIAEHKGLQEGWRGCPIWRVRRDPIVFRQHQNADTDADFLRVVKVYTSNPAWEAAGGWQSCCRVAESSQTSRSKLWSHRTPGMRCWAVGVQCWTEGCRIIDMRHRKGTEWGNDRTNEQQFEWVTLSNGT